METSMEKETLQAYTLRISQANRTELIVIIYELLLQDLQDAKGLLEDQAALNKKLYHACKCVNELITALDFRYELSYQLMRLYRYVNECIAKVKTTKENALLESAIATIDGLRVAFVEVAKQDKTGAMMTNTEQVYAGLTYSKGILNESIYSGNPSRGFQV